MLLNAHHISYTIPGGQPLFRNIQFSLNKGEKAAIVGRNGAGKTTLLQIIAGIEKDYNGTLSVAGNRLYYIPQHYGHFNGKTVAEALGILPLINAVNAVENGSTDQQYYDLLEDNWDIVPRCQAAFAGWGIAGIDFYQPLAALSGGMKTRLFLAGIDIFNPDIVLMDEPTNHLDIKARVQLMEWLENTPCAVLLTSHDRQLLQHCNPIWELGENGITVYGGNYELYETRKSEEANAAAHKLAHHEKEWKEARLKQQQALERKQHADAQARKRSAHGGQAKILMNARRVSAEDSAGQLKQVHNSKVEELKTNMQDARSRVHMVGVMKGFFSNPAFPAGKVMVQADNINYGYLPDKYLWLQPLRFTVRQGSRIAVSGNNGSGKSTLFGLLQNKLQPVTGHLQRTPCSFLQLDQDYTLIDRSKTVLQQALFCNTAHLEESAVHTLLAGFLFMPPHWNKPASALSGGEMLRLALCCMVLSNKAPDMIFLDEPTNNLDLDNIAMLGNIFSAYKGTLFVISHDTAFLKDIGITDTIQLNNFS